MSTLPREKTLLKQTDAKTQGSNFIVCVFCDYIGKRENDE